MARTRTPLVLLATLTLGVFLGVAFDRGGPFVAAQATRPPLPGPAASAGAVSPGTSVQDRGEEADYQRLARQYEQFQHVNRTFELVAKTVSRAVVHIVARKSGRNDDDDRVRQYEETGSGVIVRKDRGQGLYVLTNHHVVLGATPSQINIYLQDGRALHPDRVWSDADADIAVLNLGRDDLPAARLGDSDEATVGTWVLALGSPFGLTHSVSQGIISARGRHMDELRDVEYQDFLQTDAAINPGNSGGPLVNMKGEVIGINNSIASNGGGNEGVGFSIPMNLARWIMGQLVTRGRVSRGALGVVLRPEFRVEDARALGLESPRGAWVDVVNPRSPAAEGGVREGDVVVRFNGIEVNDLNHLINMVSMAPIGRPAEMVVWRDRKKMSMRVTVGDRDPLTRASPPVGRAAPDQFIRRPDRPNPATSSALGLELATLDEAGARRLGLPKAMRGATVIKVLPESPLAKHFRPLDVIQTVNGRAIRSADDAAKALGGRAKGEPMEVVVDRVNRDVIERLTFRIP